MPSATLQQPYTRKHAPGRVQLAKPISNNIRQVLRCWFRDSKRPIPSLTSMVVVVVSPALTFDRTITSQHRFPGTELGVEWVVVLGVCWSRGSTAP